MGYRGDCLGPVAESRDEAEAPAVRLIDPDEVLIGEPGQDAVPNSATVRRRWGSAGAATDAPSGIEPVVVGAQQEFKEGSRASRGQRVVFVTVQQCVADDPVRHRSVPGEDSPRKRRLERNLTIAE